MRYSQKSLIFLVIFITGIISGCQADKTNPEFRNVTGTVFFNGSPVEGSRVTFFPLDDSGVSASGFTDAQGKYSLTAVNSLVGGTGTKPGQYRVTIKKTEKPIDKNREDLEAGRITNEEYVKRQYSKPPTPEKTKNLLPEKYANQTKSPLNAVVENKNENVINFQLD
ncbi:MAG: carboxypeptidase-like regulatory domain-containing protein [Planctomycetaceae bacterium]|jgi:hypothetical protein|nr:carboxypeptidase-like regulatory domain-containing protein [Planctomycetaceae bacterium]